MVFNLGPAEIDICDCETDPGCGITDDDYPCGYHQTIESMASAKLATDKSTVQLVNRDRKKEARVRIKVLRGV
jgi:hypothetical protein